MSYTIEEYKVEDKLEKLNLSLPDKISFFPENLSTAEKKAEFIFTDNMIELNKHFKLNELELSVLGGDTELYRSRKMQIFICLQYSLVYLPSQKILLSCQLR